MMTVAAEQLAARRLALLAALPVGVVLMDASGTVVETNTTALRVLGLKRQPTTLKEVGRRAADPVDGIPLHERDLPWYQALAGNPVHDRDLAIAALDETPETRLVTVSAMPFDDPTSDQTGVLVVVFDRLQVLLRRTRSIELPPYLHRVLSRLCEGKSTEDIGKELGLTMATTRLYVNRLSIRLGTSGRTQLVLRAIELGLNRSRRA
jgi:regulatory LuxR family protein/PAS domain-containing protein